MIDTPFPVDLLNAVLDSLSADILPVIDKDSRFQLLMIINAIKIVTRQLSLSDANEKDEYLRLIELLQQEGTVEQLNMALSAKIASSSIDSGSSLLLDHLVKTTREKLAIDQPDYQSYRTL
ncbi:MAG: DUF6285 domain-containing protein [Spongiibacteraceae bacterium]